jgi:hypothetical protein
VGSYVRPTGWLLDAPFWAGRFPCGPHLPSVLLQWVIIMWSGLHLSAIAGLGAEGGAVVAEACRLICSETVSTEEVQVSVAVQPRAPVTERL